ncbi:MAG: class I SAM-dependent methyltransferase [Chlamydiota bacterium]
MKKIFEKIFISGAILASASSYADIPQPYASIHNLPQTPYFVQDGYIYYSLVSTHNAAVVIDVGSQDGGVARYLAQQANNLPSLTQIYSVNMWQSCDRSQKQLFRRFLSNVIQENTAELITPIRMSSRDAAEALNVQADLINLGANDEDVIYNDILRWYPHLSNTGVMCGNNWYEHSVQIGVTKAASTLDVPVQVNGHVWYLVKGS